MKKFSFVLLAGGMLAIGSVQTASAAMLDVKIMKEGAPRTEILSTQIEVQPRGDIKKTIKAKLDEYAETHHIQCSEIHKLELKNKLSHAANIIRNQTDWKNVISGLDLPRNAGTYQVEATATCS